MRRERKAERRQTSGVRDQAPGFCSPGFYPRPKTKDPRPSASIQNRAGTTYLAVCGILLLTATISLGAGGHASPGASESQC